MNNIVEEFQKVIPNIIDTVSHPEVIFAYAIDKGMCSRYTVSESAKYYIRFSVLWCCCSEGNKSLVEELLSKHPQLKKHEKYRNYLSGFLETYLATGNDTDIAFALYERDQKVRTRKQKMTVFLCAAYHGHVDLMRKLIEFDKSVLNDKNSDGYNAVSIAKVNKQDEVVAFLESEYKISGAKPERYHIDRNRKVRKVLLLGAGHVGKTTFFKQLRNSNEKYSSAEKKNFTQYIHEQIINEMKHCLDIINDVNSESDRSHMPWITKLVENVRDENDEKALDLSAEAMESAEYIRELHHTKYKLNDEIVAAIELLWKEIAIRTVYDHRSLVCIQESSTYFWDEIRQIADPEYVPSLKDCLLVNKRTTGVKEMEISESGIVFNIVDTGGQKSERKKWITCFDHVTAVIYVSSLNSFDQVMFEDYSANSMEDQFKLFGDICNQPALQKATMVLLLNQTDLFKEKIKRVPITECSVFSDFEGDTKSFEETTAFIKEKFEGLNQGRREILTHFTCAIDTPSTLKTWRAIQESIIAADLAASGFIF